MEADAPKEKIREKIEEDYFEDFYPGPDHFEWYFDRHDLGNLSYELIIEEDEKRVARGKWDFEKIPRSQDDLFLTPEGDVSFQGDWVGDDLGSVYVTFEDGNMREGEFTRKDELMEVLQLFKEGKEGVENITKGWKKELFSYLNILLGQSKLKDKFYRPEEAKIRYLDVDLESNIRRCEVRLPILFPVGISFSVWRHIKPLEHNLEFTLNLATMRFHETKDGGRGIGYYENDSFNEREGVDFLNTEEYRPGEKALIRLRESFEEEFATEFQRRFEKMAEK